MVRKILIEGRKKKNKHLRKKSIKVTSFDSNLKKLISDMSITMNAHKGIGISACQIGVLKQVCIINAIGKKPVIICNPRILKYEGEPVALLEGCLSIPGKFAPVLRYKELTVEYEDIEGITRKAVALDQEAHAIQHEISHMNGVLFTDLIVD